MIIAGTGHRPDKLGGYNPNNPVRMSVFHETEALLMEIKPTYVITGMALGFDQLLAEVCIGLGIPFVAAIPFEGQESVWPKPAKDKYHQLLEKANSKFIVSPGGYSPDKMHIRNEWMVNEATQIIACWDKSPGGTGSCVSYAMNVGKPIHFINEFVKIRDGEQKYLEGDYAFQKTLKFSTKGYVPPSPVSNVQVELVNELGSPKVGKIPVSDFLKGLKEKTDQAQKETMTSLEYVNALKQAVAKKNETGKAPLSLSLLKKGVKFGTSYSSLNDILTSVDLTAKGSVADFLYGGALDAVSKQILGITAQLNLDTEDQKTVSNFIKFTKLWTTFAGLENNNETKDLFTLLSLTAKGMKKGSNLPASLESAIKTANLAGIMESAGGIIKNSLATGHKKKEEEVLPEPPKVGRKMNLD